MEEDVIKPHPESWYNKHYAVYCRYCGKHILSAPYYELELLGHATMDGSFCCKRHEILNKLKKAGERND